jgi:hypothetical protein
MNKTFNTLSALLVAMTLSAASVQGQQSTLPTTMLPLQIDEVVVNEEGGLTALGSLGENLFDTTVDLSTVNGNGGENGDICPILQLRLGPIDLNLLGLRVETSPICLLIAGQEGEGQLLGNLLCPVARLLDGGLNLEDILGGLTETELTELLTGIRDLLNEVLGQATAPTSIAGVSGTVDDTLALLSHRPEHGQGQGRGQGRGEGRGGGRDNAPGQQRPAAECDILNLTLGPVELNLLGLVVVLDDCDGGPVTVDITAQPGEGQLLGNLLCQLAGLLDGGSNQVLTRLLNQIVGEINNLL